MSDARTVEKYRLTMIAIINKLSARASAQHKDRLAIELEWFQSRPDEPTYVDLQQRHRDLPALFRAVVESGNTADQAVFGREILDDFLRADALLNALTQPDIVRQRLSRVAADTRNGPIFLISSWRSGSTLLMSLLGSHERLVALPENNLLDPFLMTPADTSRNIRPLLYRRRPAIVDACLHTAHLGVSDERFYECFATFIDSVLAGYVREHGGERWVYKESVNADSVPLIDILFGYRARFIWLIRHGLDVVNSEIERYEARGMQCADLSEYAREWVFANELFADFHDRTPDRCIKVRFEDLIASPQSEMRRLLEFLQEPWDEGLFGRARSSTQALGGDPKFTSSQGKVDAARTGRWKLWPRVHIEQMGRIVNPMLGRVGYDLV